MLSSQLGYAIGSCCCWGCCATAATGWDTTDAMDERGGGPIHAGASVQHLRPSHPISPWHGPPLALTPNSQQMPVPQKFVSWHSSVWAPPHRACERQQLLKQPSPLLRVTPTGLGGDGASCRPMMQRKRSRIAHAIRMPKDFAQGWEYLYCIGINRGHSYLYWFYE